MKLKKFVCEITMVIGKHSKSTFAIVEAPSDTLAEAISIYYENSCNKLAWSSPSSALNVDGDVTYRSVAVRCSNNDWVAMIKYLPDYDYHHAQLETCGNFLHVSACSKLLSEYPRG